MLKEVEWLYISNLVKQVTLLSKPFELLELFDLIPDDIVHSIGQAGFNQLIFPLLHIWASTPGKHAYAAQGVGVTEHVSQGLESDINPAHLLLAALKDKEGVHPVPGLLTHLEHGKLNLVLDVLICQVDDPSGIREAWGIKDDEVLSKRGELVDLDIRGDATLAGANWRKVLPCHVIDEGALSYLGLAYGDQSYGVVFWICDRWSHQYEPI